MHFIKKIFFFEKNIGALCSKITETQITNIDYENILGLKNFSKKIIGIKKTKHKKNPKKLRDFAMAYIHMPLWGNFNILNLGEYKFSVESLLIGPRGMWGLRWVSRERTQFFATISVSTTDLSSFGSICCAIYYWIEIWCNCNNAITPLPSHNIFLLILLFYFFIFIFIFIYLVVEI